MQEAEKGYTRINSDWQAVFVKVLGCQQRSLYALKQIIHVGGLVSHCAYTLFLLIIPSNRSPAQPLLLFSTCPNSSLKLLFLASFDFILL